jgi:inorganic pyrophosphatase
MSAAEGKPEEKAWGLQAYRRPRDPQRLRHDYVAFAGSPRQHPFDPQRIVLITDPFSTHACYFEFDMQAVAYAEELPSLVNLDGETLAMARIWVKKGSLGVQSIPFIVADATEPR